MEIDEKEWNALKSRVETANAEIAALTKERDTHRSGHEAVKTQLGSVIKERDEFKTSHGSAQSQIAALTRELGEHKAAHETAKGRAAELEALRTKDRDALAGLHRKTMLSGIIDADCLALAPKVELDADGNPTQASADALATWRGAKSHLFTPAASGGGGASGANGTGAAGAGGAGTAGAAGAGGQGAGGGGRPNTPVVDAAGNQMSWEYWDNLREKSPQVFGERQREFLDWANAQEKAGKQ